MKIIMVIAICILVFLCAFAMAIYLEKKAFNNGRCPTCNYPLRLFDKDSQGGRGYKCDKCNYITWVSYPTVDKNYRKDNEDE